LNYSYNLDRKDIIFASARDINASFKDLCNVCDAVRYKPLPAAIKVLDGVINDGKAIEFRRHNRYMGSRHELGGKKGRYPQKCAAIVRKVLINVQANAKNKGADPEFMYVVHAAANKTYEVPRAPPKGVRSVGGNYGYGSVRRSNLEYARVEIGVADKETKELGNKMKRALKAVSRKEKPIAAPAPAKKATPAKPAATKTASTPAPAKPAAVKPLPAPTPATETKKDENQTV
jgi:large subunit ribosomal protein L22